MLKIPLQTNSRVFEIYTTFSLVNSLEQHEISRINRNREFKETVDMPRNRKCGGI